MVVTKQCWLWLSTVCLLLSFSISEQCSFWVLTSMCWLLTDALLLLMEYFHWECWQVWTSKYSTPKLFTERCSLWILTSVCWLLTAYTSTDFCSFFQLCIYIFLHLTTMCCTFLGGVGGCWVFVWTFSVVLACVCLHICTVCIWRCEHTRICVAVFMCHV